MHEMLALGKTVGYGATCHAIPTHVMSCHGISWHCHGIVMKGQERTSRHRKGHYRTGWSGTGREVTQRDGRRQDGKERYGERRQTTPRTTPSDATPHLDQVVVADARMHASVLNNWCSRISVRLRRVLHGLRVCIMSEAQLPGGCWLTCSILQELQLGLRTDHQQAWLMQARCQSKWHAVESPA